MQNDEVDALMAGAEIQWMPQDEMTEQLRAAIIEQLPAGAGFVFNTEGDQAYVMVSLPHRTPEVYEQAKRQLQQ